MLRFSQTKSRGAVVLVAVMAIALSACGGGSATPTPTAGGSGATSQASATSQPSPTATGLAGAVSALAARTSYRFTMIVEGGSIGDTLSMLPAESADSAVFELKGTIVNKPAKAADVTVTGMVHVVSVDGSDYVDMAVGGKLTGEFTKNDLSAPNSDSSAEPSSQPSPQASPQPSLAETLSPIYFYSAFDFTKGFDKQESVTVSGVETDHYVANDAGKAALGELGSVAGVPDANWTGDVWLARDGDYPVKMVIIAKTGPAGSEFVVFQRQLTITNVDDPENKVTAPTNVTGA
ncbi:MAG: hypothetical protein ABSB75_08995 [Candidatus Limnocylindrales bacterium]